MARLESGPAWGDRLYNGGVCLAVFLFGMYFIYDHYIGYPNQNRAEAVKVLNGLTSSEIDPESLRTDLTKPDYEVFKEDRKQSAEATTVGQLHEALGEPTHIKQELEAGSSMHYFASLYGMATVPIRDGRVDVIGMDWQKWKHTKHDIEGQFVWAFLPFTVALYFFYLFIRASLLRAVLDDEGLNYGGVKVPFDRMTALKDYSPKGWIDLHFDDEANTHRKLRIDNQKIAAFRPLVDAICEVKGFENEVAIHEEKMAQADEAFAQSNEPEIQASDDATTR